MPKNSRNYFVAYKMGDECGWSVVSTEQPVTSNGALMQIQDYIRGFCLEKGVPEEKAEKLIITAIQRLEDKEEKPCLITGN